MLKPGKIHRVDCGWCGLKMACNCFLGDAENHVQVLCPRCQVTELVNEMFFSGDKADAQSKPASGRPLRLVPPDRP